MAQRFRVGVATVHLWVQRARGHRLDRVAWADRPSRPRTTQRTDPALEERVLTLRRELKEQSALGEFGAATIHRELLRQGRVVVPSLRTIGRILERRGALDARRRVRRPPPPLGWYLPDVAAGQAEVDSLDIIEGLVIEGGIPVEVLNGISLQGGVVASWPRTAITAQTVVDALIAHWRLVGRPTYAQFDNDPRFQGSHRHPDVLGRVIRLCLSVAVVPVFVPVRETGFQAAIESLNARWQAKVWRRFHHDCLAALQARSAQYVAAYRHRAAARSEAAPARRPFPQAWRLNLQAQPRGRLVYLRRTSEHGQVHLLGHHFLVDPSWLHRLVRAEIDLDAGTIHFYGLRRRDPGAQPLLHTAAYQLPKRRFRE